MSKRTTAEMRQLDVRDLDEHELLNPGWRGQWKWLRDGDVVAKIGLRCESRHRLRLIYTSSSRFSDEETKHDYTVPLDYTEPHFGGERPWFLCPGKGCGRRCAILYGGAVFVCRECRDLAYPRENMSGNRWRVAIYRLRKVARKLDVDPAEYAPAMMPIKPPRPKGMHRSTYRELLADYREAYEDHERAFYADMVELLDTVGADVGLSDQDRALLESAPG